MMKQLLKQIYNERRSNAFLWIELLLVFVVLWYIVDLVYVTLHIYYQPMGFNIENTYVLRMNRLTDKSTDFNPELTVKDDMAAFKGNSRTFVPSSGGRICLYLSKQYSI